MIIMIRCLGKFTYWPWVGADSCVTWSRCDARCCQGSLFLTKRILIFVSCSCCSEAFIYFLQITYSYVFVHLCLCIYISTYFLFIFENHLFARRLIGLASCQSRTCYISCMRDGATLRQLNYMHLHSSYVTRCQVWCTRDDATPQQVNYMHLPPSYITRCQVSCTRDDATLSM